VRRITRYAWPPPPSALDLAGEGSDLSPPSITPSPPSITPSGLVTGASDVGDTGAGLTDGGYGAVLTDMGDTGADLTLTIPVITGVGPATAVPEASTWAMMLLGFAGLALRAMGTRPGSHGSTSTKASASQLT
jgi:hypothetical protein